MPARRGASPIDHAFGNLVVTAGVCLGGVFDSMGEAMVCDFDGTAITPGTTGRPDEIIAAEVRPDLAAGRCRGLPASARAHEPGGGEAAE